MPPPDADSAESDSDSHDDIFVQIPETIPDGTGEIFSAISSLCYGQHNSVDLLELCGGTAGISKAAFRRGLSSGGNIGLTTGCNLDHLEVQHPVLHYLDTCYVLVVILQANCRTLGKVSNLNAWKYPHTWQQHHE